jgi:hypothetical protein
MGLVSRKSSRSSHKKVQAILREDMVCTVGMFLKGVIASRETDRNILKIVLDLLDTSKKEQLTGRGHAFTAPGQRTDIDRELSSAS